MSSPTHKVALWHEFSDLLEHSTLLIAHLEKHLLFYSFQGSNPTNIPASVTGIKTLFETHCLALMPNYN